MGYLQCLRCEYLFYEKNKQFPLNFIFGRFTALNLQGERPRKQNYSEYLQVVIYLENVN